MMRCCNQTNETAIFEGMKSPASCGAQAQGSEKRLLKRASDGSLGIDNCPAMSQEQRASVLNICKPGVKSLGAAKKRLVSKDGDILVEVRNVHGSERWRFFHDLFTSLIQLKWRYVLLLFCASYVAAWVFFGCLWALLVVAYGAGYCVEKVDNFSSAFYFSVETQQTIGYGGRQITTNCVLAGLILQAQSLVGNLIDCILLGLIFSKIVRPIKRAKTIVFSKNMLVGRRGKNMCLMFQVTDLRESQIVESHIRLQLFHTVEDNGTVRSYHQQDLSVQYDWSSEKDGQEQLFVLLPITILHIIDENSPFYELTPDKLLTMRFEMVAVLDGIVESTGMNTQAKTSYLQDEILWGYDFANLISEDHYDEETGKIWVDFSKMGDLVQIDLPELSARDQAYSLTSPDVENPTIYV